jgi:hypothetical protein
LPSRARLLKPCESSLLVWWSGPADLHTQRASCAVCFCWLQSLPGSSRVCSASLLTSPLTACKLSGFLSRTQPVVISNLHQSAPRLL